MSTSCECQFEDSNYLPGTCGLSTGVANISLFMTFVDVMLRSDCSIADPCRRYNTTDFNPMTDSEFDFIVVGAGVAGSVMASRLSEQANWRVLLLEAGGEEPTTAAVPAFALTPIGTEVDWKFQTEPQQYACLSTNGVCNWPRGKMMGGSGAMNGMIYTRGHRQLYDDWAASGSPGWSYEEVLPYFIKAEGNRNPEEVDPEYHGFNGPLTVQRFSYQPAIADDVLTAAEELGYLRGDLSGYNQTGFAVAQVMVDDGLRASTARMYIRPNRNRENLVVKINSQVTKIIIDSINMKATAVEYRDHLGITRQVIAKKEVVLSAGAVGSPHLLLLSGIGPSATLEEFNIPVIKNLPVGYSLHNHVATSVTFFIDDNDKRILTMSALQTFLDKHEGPLASTGLSQVTGFVKSKYAQRDIPDIQVFFYGFFAKCSETGDEEECSDGTLAEICGRRFIRITSANILTRSTGYLTLNSSDPLDPPAINPNYLSENIDVQVLIEGIKFIIELSKTEALRKWGFELDDTPTIGCENLTFASDEYWECHIRQNTGPENHPSSSCRMGAVDDSTAVVDAELRVHGVPNLRVADASVLRKTPNGNPTAAIVMIAEKGADMITADWRLQEATAGLSTTDSLSFV